MPRPIKMSEEIIQQMVSEFEHAVRDLKTVDGKVSYTRAVTYKSTGAKIVIDFAPIAFLKMTALIREFTSEVAWHGTVERVSPTRFLIKDILVYPQKVTGSTVNTDQEAYAQWMQELDNETFNSLRFQGHSHVNMGVSPSPTDIDNQGRIVSQFTEGSDHFYIFMIWNKSMAFNARVFDMAANAIYDTDEVEIEIGGHPFHLEGFIKDAKDTVKTSYSYAATDKTGKSSGKKYAYSNYNGWEDDEEIMRKYRYMS